MCADEWAASTMKGPLDAWRCVVAKRCLSPAPFQPVFSCILVLTDCTGVLRDIQVRVGYKRPRTNKSPEQLGDTLCATAASIPAGTTTIYCTGPTTGVYVNIQLMGSSTSLVLCEVAVMGADSGIPEASVTAITTAASIEQSYVCHEWTPAEMDALGSSSVDSVCTRGGYSTANADLLISCIGCDCCAVAGGSFPFQGCIWTGLVVGLCPRMAPGEGRMGLQNRMHPLIHPPLRPAGSLPSGTATQVSTQGSAAAALAVDGNTPLTCAETLTANQPWWWVA